MQISSRLQFGNHLSRRLKTDQGIKRFEFYCYDLLFIRLCIFIYIFFYYYLCDFLAGITVVLHV